MIEIRATDRSPAGLAEVAALLRRRFPRAAQISPEYLAWSYLGNPAGAAFAFDARDGERVVAHFAATPLRARLAGSEEPGLLTQHAATERGYEGRGLFQALVQRALAAGAERGFDHAVAFANANSRFAFVERLGFRLLGSLDVRVGIGPSPCAGGRTAASWERVWDARSLAWRLARPDEPYRAVLGRGHARILCASGYPGVLAEVACLHDTSLPRALPPPPRGALLRVWIGLDPGRRWSGRAYARLPLRLRPAPLHFAFRDLRGDRVPTPGAIRAAAIDFDAY